jgi:tRNA nucleotidyltransferase (CCA-adding enzyme)
VSPGSRRLLDAAIAAAREQRCELWAVGGAVRDVAAGATPREVDLATDGDAARLARRTARALGLPRAAAHVEPRFGTASIEAPSDDAAHGLDIARLRAERYARPGALPEVRYGASIEQDLARRDFTVNAMALRLVGPGGTTRAGGLVDPLDGFADLRARLLRAHHARSFADDATRLWRGARFAARLSLRPEPETARWIAEGGRWLAPISGQRLWAEFERLAAERSAGGALARLESWGTLAATHRALAPADAATRALRRRRGPLAPELLLALLLADRRADARRAAASRLSATRPARLNAEDAAVLLAAGRRAAGRAPTPAALDRLAGTGQPARDAVMWLDAGGQRPLQQALRRWERTASPLAAAALIELGVPPGPQLGWLLALLRRERYLGRLSGAAEARARVRCELDAARRAEARGRWARRDDQRRTTR